MERSEGGRWRERKIGVKLINWKQEEISRAKKEEIEKDEKSELDRLHREERNKMDKSEGGRET